MKEFKMEELTIYLDDMGKKVLMSWLGKSRSLDPAKYLDPFLQEVVDEVKGKELEVDFTSLDCMNSSTIPPILSFIKSLECKNVTTIVLYDGSVDWQRASFVPLASVINLYKYVKIVVS